MDNFKAELDDKLKSGMVREYPNSQNIFIQVFNNHCTAKKNRRFNNIPFMAKTLRTAIMHRCRLQIYISLKEMINIGKVIRNKEIFVLTFFVKLKQNILKI